MSICCECCVLSDRGLCEGLITRPEESYRLWCVVCDLETTKILVIEEEVKAHQGAMAPREKRYYLVIFHVTWEISISVEHLSFMVGLNFTRPSLIKSEFDLTLWSLNIK